jgi:hypothetical protein
MKAQVWMIAQVWVGQGTAILIDYLMRRVIGFGNGLLFAVTQRLLTHQVKRDRE